jgi:hypothetical protein
MRTSSLLLVLAFTVSALHADTVKLSDGSSLSGQVTQLDNGDLSVTTGAGTLTVPKSKVVAVVTDGSAAAEHRNEYVEKVLERRRAYGNEDGLPRTQNLQQQQILFTVGQINNVGDAFLVKDPNSGATLLSAADLAGLSFGLAFARSYTDYIALEAWADYSAAAKDFTVSGTGNRYKLQRYNIGLGPKLQFATRVGRVESGMALIPSLGLTPVWSGANGEITSNTGGSIAQSFNSSSVGASFNAGLDFQFGGALLSLKLRYLLTSDVTGNLKNNNTSALLPQIGAGFAF